MAAARQGGGHRNRGMRLTLLFYSQACLIMRQNASFAIRREFPATIFEFLDLFSSKFLEIWKIGFLDSQDQNQILNFCSICLYDKYFLYKPLFPSSQPLKPLKSRPQGQNLPGDPLIAHSDHQGPVSAQFCTTRDQRPPPILL